MKRFVFALIASCAASACFDLEPQTQRDAPKDPCSGPIAEVTIYSGPRQVVHRVATGRPPYKMYQAPALTPSMTAAQPRLFDDAPRGPIQSFDDVLLLCRMRFAAPAGWDRTTTVPLTLGLVKFDTSPLLSFMVGVGKSKPIDVAHEFPKPELFIHFHTKLEPNAPFSFTLGVDYAKKNKVGPLTTTFDGSLPLRARDATFSYECQGYDRAGQEAIRSRSIAVIDAALASPVAVDQIDRLTVAAEDLAAVDGPEAEKVKAAARRLAEMTSEKINRGPRELEALREAAAPQGKWVALDDDLEARGNGVLCYMGGFYICGIELDLRLKKPRAMCPLDDDRLGPLTFVAHDSAGDRYALEPQSISLYAEDAFGAPLRKQEDLKHLEPGRIYALELGFRSIVPYNANADAPTGFSVPVLEVKTARGDRRYFRTY